MIKKNMQLSVYELGIIRNSLRGAILRMEVFRTHTSPNEDEVKMNNNIDAFRLELEEIKDKINLMSEIQIMSETQIKSSYKKQISWADSIRNLSRSCVTPTLGIKQRATAQVFSGFLEFIFRQAQQ